MPSILGLVAYVVVIMQDGVHCQGIVLPASQKPGVYDVEFHVWIPVTGGRVNLGVQARIFAGNSH